MTTSVALPSTRSVVRDSSLALALLVIVAVFAWLAPSFLSARNLSNLGVEFAITAVLALGVFLVLLPGQTDLATGSGVGLAGGAAAVLIMHHGWPAPLALGAAFVGIVVLWIAMGALIVRQRLPAFIITLGGMLVFRGLHWMVIDKQTVPVQIGDQGNLLSALTTWYLPTSLSWPLAAIVIAVLAWSARRDRAQRRSYGLTVETGDIAFARWFIGAQLIVLLVVVLTQFHGIPLPILALGVVATGVQVVTRRTRFGRHLYAIGGNREASLLSGIRVDRAVIAAFAACGAIVALTGFLQTAYAGGSTTTIGTLMELDAIAACVIGGVSLAGGVGNVVGVLFGALIMAALMNGMTLLAIEPEWKLIVRGGVLVLAVWMDTWGRQRR